ADDQTAWGQCRSVHRQNALRSDERALADGSVVYAGYPGLAGPRRETQPGIAVPTLPYEHEMASVLPGEEWPGGEWIEGDLGWQRTSGNDRLLADDLDRDRVPRRCSREEAEG